ncbi:MAG: ribonuclease HI family protein [Candidatus Omnitrophica bacterium]|nr:ribonuclease HI family protein [Candidatus Omnitrophota bacterium]
MNKIDLYIDGASKGNPGPAGIGVVLCSGGEVVKNISDFIGNATNNVAEYTALIYGLQEALILKARILQINTDSQLLARQINKDYKVKHPNIIPLYNQAIRLIQGFEEVCVKHIPREENSGADKLANLAIKKAVKSKN